MSGIGRGSHFNVYFFLYWLLDKSFWQFTIFHYLSSFGNSPNTVDFFTLYSLAIVWRYAPYLYFKNFPQWKLWVIFIVCWLSESVVTSQSITLRSLSLRFCCKCIAVHSVIRAPVGRGHSFNTDVSTLSRTGQRAQLVPMAAKAFWIAGSPCLEPLPSPCPKIHCPQVQCVTMVTEGDSHPL